MGKEREPMPALRKIMIWLLTLFAAILVAGLAALVGSERKLAKETNERCANLIEGRLEEIDNHLSAVNLYMTEQLLTGTAVENILSAQDPQRRNVAARELWGDIYRQRKYWNEKLNFFFYAPQNGAEVFCYDGAGNYADCNRLRRMVKERWKNGELGTGDFRWKPVSIEGRVYLLQCYTENGAVAACWSSWDEAMTFLVEDVLTEEGFYIVLDQNGEPVVPDQRLEEMQGRETGWADFSGSFSMDYARLVLAVADSPRRNREAQLAFMAFFVVTLIVVAGFSIYTLTYFQRFIQRPFVHLKEHVADYDSVRKNVKRRGFAELEMAMSAFDALAAQLNQLKIDQYEERMALAKTQLEYFQLQIKPHFFVNCFSILFGMAQKKEYQRIQNFCLKLSDYVRYLFRDGLSIVPLEGELGAIQDFLGIQDIRHRTESLMDQDVAPELAGVNIPPLLLLTFVENAVKHGEDSGQMSVFVRAEEWREGEKNFLRFLISGSCSAFSPEDLQALNALPVKVAQGEEAGPGDGRHIGVKNICSRLTLMYGEEYSLRFYNREGHSVAEIILPDRRTGKVAENGNLGLKTVKL